MELSSSYLRTLHSHRVIPAKAGTHPEMRPALRQLRDLRMGPGLRRGDTVFGARTGNDS
jgi:hypothetical protein